VFVIAVIVVAAVLGWWRWQQGWKALEAQVPAKATVAAKPKLKVPNEAMQQRIRHLVRPEYPEDARQAGVQGTVVLDAVVDPEGAVTHVRFVSGPEQLSPAAIDAVRWWRYEPYLVNGQPATIRPPWLWTSGWVVSFPGLAMSFYLISNNLAWLSVTKSQLSES
jgi:TonB family protein